MIASRHVTRYPGGKIAWHDGDTGTNGAKLTRQEMGWPHRKLNGELDNQLTVEEKSILAATTPERGMVKKRQSDGFISLIKALTLHAVGQIKDAVFIAEPKFARIETYRELPTPADPDALRMKVVQAASFLFGPPEESKSRKRGAHKTGDDIRWKFPNPPGFYKESRHQVTLKAYQKGDMFRIEIVFENVQLEDMPTTMLDSHSLEQFLLICDRTLEKVFETADEMLEAVCSNLELHPNGIDVAQLKARLRELRVRGIDRDNGIMRLLDSLATTGSFTNSGHRESLKVSRSTLKRLSNPASGILDEIYQYPETKRGPIYHLRGDWDQQRSETKMTQAEGQQTPNGGHGGPFESVEDRTHPHNDLKDESQTGRTCCPTCRQPVPSQNSTRT